MNGALLARLRFIDFLLDHYGQVRPQHLMDYFGIGPAQASRDLRAYQELATGNAEYDPSGKLYWKSTVYTRVWP